MDFELSGFLLVSLFSLTGRSLIDLALDCHKLTVNVVEALF